MKRRLTVKERIAKAVDEVVLGIEHGFKFPPGYVLINRDAYGVTESVYYNAYEDCFLFLKSYQMDLRTEDGVRLCVFRSSNPIPNSVNPYSSNRKRDLFIYIGDL